MPRALLAVVVLALLALDGTPANGADGDRCRHSRECTSGAPAACIADDDYSDVGRCRDLRVLP